MSLGLLFFMLTIIVLGNLTWSFQNPWPVSSWITLWDDFFPYCGFVVIVLYILSQYSCNHFKRLIAIRPVVHPVTRDRQHYK